MTRAGYAGEDTPRVMFPTSFGYIDTEEEEEQVTKEATVGEEDVEMTESDQQQPALATTTEKKTVKKRQYFIGDNRINKFRSHMEVKNPMKDGMGKSSTDLKLAGSESDLTLSLCFLNIVDDWEAIEQIWDTTFNNMLRISPENHPLLCTEPAWNTKEKREKTMELTFEKFQFPAFYLAQDAVMTA